RHTRSKRDWSSDVCSSDLGGYDTLVELRAKQSQDRLTRDEGTRKDALERYYETKLGIFSRLLDDGMRPLLVVSSDAGPFDCEFRSEERRVGKVRTAREAGG